MLKLTEDLSLQEINIDNQTQLHYLMCKIYPFEYNHFWIDDCSWHINNQYSKENLLKELSEEKQHYYFVIYKEEAIGILRLLFDAEMKKFPNKKAVKLHRIYLDHKAQGNGIGNILLSYVERLVKENNYDILWLEGMEKKPKAMRFYKNFGFLKGEEYLYEFDLLKKEYQKMIAFYKTYF